MVGEGDEAALSEGMVEGIMLNDGAAEIDGRDEG